MKQRLLAVLLLGAVTPLAAQEIDPDWCYNLSGANRITAGDSISGSIDAR